MKEVGSRQMAGGNWRNVLFVLPGRRGAVNHVALKTKARGPSQSVECLQLDLLSQYNLQMFA